MTTIKTAWDSDVFPTPRDSEGNPKEPRFTLVVKHLDSESVVHFSDISTEMLDDLIQNIETSKVASFTVTRDR